MRRPDASKQITVIDQSTAVTSPATIPIKFMGLSPRQRRTQGKDGGARAQVQIMIKVN
jgi:hypothetical protein